MYLYGNTWVDKSYDDEEYKINNQPRPHFYGLILVASQPANKVRSTVFYTQIPTGWLAPAFYKQNPFTL